MARPAVAGSTLAYVTGTTVLWLDSLVFLASWLLSLSGDLCS